MLHTIPTLVGLILLAAIAVAAFTVLGILTDKDRDRNTTLLFSKMDHVILNLRNLQDKVNKVPDADSIGRWMQQAEKSTAQLLASMEESKETLKDCHRLLMNTDRCVEQINSKAESLDSIAGFVDCTRLDVAVLKDLAEEADKPVDMPEDSAAESDRKPAEEKTPGRGTTIAEKYERMKERVAAGMSWKEIAAEFGYTRQRDARRFFERKQAKEKKAQEQ